jgi:hypothetical protein
MWDASGGGPLANMPTQVNQVLTGAGYGQRRHMNPVEAAAVGAAAGFAGYLVWQNMKKRRALKGEYTSPGVRWFLFFLVPFTIGSMLALSHNAEIGIFLGGGFVLGVVLSVYYAIYRIAGGGRYNTRRQGSPFRADHQGGGRHRAF